MENGTNVLKSRDLSLQRFVGFFVCHDIHSQHCSSSLSSTQSIGGLILLVSFWWQHDLCSFLATDKMFLPLEHKTSRAATAPWVSNDHVLGKVPACMRSMVIALIEAIYMLKFGQNDAIFATNTRMVDTSCSEIVSQGRIQGGGGGGGGTGSTCPPPLP